MPSNIIRMSMLRRRICRKSMSCWTICRPMVISAGTAAAPKPEAMAIAISTTWVKAAITMLYWVDSESSANSYAAPPSAFEMFAPSGTYWVIWPWY